MARDGYDKRATDRSYYDRQEEKKFVKEQEDAEEYRLYDNYHGRIAFEEGEIIRNAMAREVQEGNAEGIVIVLVGPPHSGKSCLNRFLSDKFSKGMVNFIDMTPDGENPSIGAKNSNENSIKRIKGKFNPKVNKTKLEQLIESKENYPITIADLGGAFSLEKPDILKLANYGIVLSNNEKDMRRWSAYLANYDVQLMAELLSIEGKGFDEILNKSPSPMGVFKAKIHDLDRNSEKEHSEVTDTLLMRISNSYLHKNGFPPKIQERINKGNIDLDTFAEMFKKNLNPRTGTYEWDIESLNPIIQELSSVLGGQEIADFDNCNPQFLVGAVTQCAIDMGVPNIGFRNRKAKPLTVIPQNHKKLKPNVLSDRVSVMKVLPDKNLEVVLTETDTAIHLEFAQVGGEEPINSKDLKKIRLPELDESKQLIISGNASDVLISSAVQTYRNREKYIKQTGLGIVQIGSKEPKNIGKATLGLEGMNTYEGMYMYNTRILGKEIQLNDIVGVQAYVDNMNSYLEDIKISKDSQDLSKENIEKFTIAEIVRAALSNADIRLRRPYWENLVDEINKQKLDKYLSRERSYSLIGLRESVVDKLAHVQAARTASVREMNFAANIAIDQNSRVTFKQAELTKVYKGDQEDIERAKKANKAAQAKDKDEELKKKDKKDDIDVMGI